MHMLGSTHKRIGQKIAVNLNLNERETKVLTTGSVSPDDWANFPHHKGKEKEIIDNITQARILFLVGDDECYNNLGIAFHYIQDRWTLAPRLRDKHTTWEIKVDSLPILDAQRLAGVIKEALLPTKVEQSYLAMLDNIKSSVADAGKYNLECKTSLRGLAKDVIAYALLNRPSSTLSDPQIDLNFAYIICNEVGRLVTLTDVQNKGDEAKLLHSSEKKLVGPLVYPSALKLYFPDDYLSSNVPSIPLQQIQSIYGAIVYWFNRVQNTNLNRMPNNNLIGDLMMLNSLRHEHIHFRGDNLVTEQKGNDEQTIYRLSIGMFCYGKLLEVETIEPLLLDFSSFFEAEYLKEALNCNYNFSKRCADEDRSKSIFSLYNYLKCNNLEKLLNIRVPVDHSNFEKFVNEYRTNKESEANVLKEIDELVKDGKVFWFDKVHLKYKGDYFVPDLIRKGEI